MQSGNALISWSTTHEPVKWAFEVGRKLGHEVDDPKELVKYLKTVSAEDIVKAMLRILDDIREVSYFNGILILTLRLKIFIYPFTHHQMHRNFPRGLFIAHSRHQWKPSKKVLFYQIILRP